MEPAKKEEKSSPPKNTWRRHMESEKIKLHMAQARNGNLWQKQMGNRNHQWPTGPPGEPRGHTKLDIKYLSLHYL